MTERIKTVIILTSIINYSKKLEKTEYMTERENKRDYSEPDNRDIIGLKDYQIKIIEEQNDHPQMEELDQPEEMTEDTTGKVSPLVTDFREAKIWLHPGSGFMMPRNGCAGICTGWMPTSCFIISAARQDFR